MIDYEKIKLVIWDLDETFWKGTLSDNNVEIIEDNVQLVKNMTDAGVICSICSKNEESQVEKVLRDVGIYELFVFKSINWTPKGDRVKQIIEEMNLREPNVLFIDDNNTNLGEVKNSCPNMMCENIDVIPGLIEYFENCEKKDTKHSRLDQYKVLERKQEFKAKSGSNVEFLLNCNIQVEIKKDSLKKISRIHDLVLRSNQLNFTKVRSSIEELEELLNDPEVEHGYVEVKDAFGDYGIVGFFAVKDKKLIHFVFSCRTLNMGIEQYVYHQLDKPQLEVAGEVSSSLEGEFPFWINQDNNKSVALKSAINKSAKIVIKGPCDMSQMFSYIKETKNIITEFVYVNDKGVSIEQANHSTHMVESKTLSEEDKLAVINDLPFGDKDMYNTTIYNQDVSAIIYSLFTDPNLGLYKNKNNGAKVAFGEYTNNLTDELVWEQLINGERFNANCKFTKENLTYIKDNYDYIGRLNPDQIIENLSFIYQNINANALLILVLGSEMEYQNNTQEAYVGRHQFNIELNNKVKEWARDKDRVKFIDVNEFISGQQDFTNNINHFKKEIYFKMSQKMIELLKDCGGENVTQITIFGKIARRIKYIIKKCTRRIKKIFTRK